MTDEEWATRGRNLAALTPTRFTLPPDSAMEVLADATRAYQATVPQRNVRPRPTQDDEAMAEVPVQLAHVAHLAEVCHAVTAAAKPHQQPGCAVVQAHVHKPSTKAMEEALDRSYLTARKPNAKYIKGVLGNQSFWWLKDTGANFTVITTKLCK